MSVSQEIINVKEVQRYGVATSNLSQHSGYIGLSICSHFYSKKNLRAVIEYGSKRFEKFTILIADEPQTYTFLSMKETSFEFAFQKAIKIGKEKYNSVCNIIQSLNVKNVTVMRWNEVSTDPVFQDIKLAMYDCYENNSKFKEAIHEQIILRNNFLKVEQDYALIPKYRFNVAAIYVLNEIAVMSYLQELKENNLKIQVYPFSMPPALIGLYDGKYGECVKLNSKLSGYIQIEIDN